MAEAFAWIDRNGDGTISRIELIQACRRDERVRALLGLPQTIRQEDGTRDAFERAFQHLDADDSKGVTLDEFLELAPHFIAEGAPADDSQVSASSTVPMAMPPPPTGARAAGSIGLTRALGTSSPVPAANPSQGASTELVQVEVPAGAVGGEVLVVESASGGQYEVLVPDGAAEGEIIEIELPVDLAASDAGENEAGTKALELPPDTYGQEGGPFHTLLQERYAHLQSPIGPGPAQSSPPQQSQSPATSFRKTRSGRYLMDEREVSS